MTIMVSDGDGHNVQDNGDNGNSDDDDCDGIEDDDDDEVTHCSVQFALTILRLTRLL